MILLLVALQATAAVPSSGAPAGSQRWSILAPVDDRRCRTRASDEGDIVVCGDTPSERTAPLPGDHAPGASPRGANPTFTGAGALAAEGTPCAAVQQGCTVGFGPPIVPIVQRAVGVVRSAFAHKPDKSNRVPIPLDDPATP